MLRDGARQFYFDNLMKENLNFDEMVSRTREFFHTVEDRQMYIQEWRSTTFVRIVKANPDKDLSQCFEILVSKLQKIYKGLSGATRRPRAQRNSCSTHARALKHASW